jgi:hypothetical protein
MSSYNENKNVILIVLVLLIIGAIVWYSVYLSLSTTDQQKTKKKWSTEQCDNSAGLQKWSAWVGLMVASFLILSIAYHYYASMNR